MASDKGLFRQTPPEGAARAQLRRRAAEDLLMLIDPFAGHKRIADMSSYKAMIRVFGEQCKVTGGEIIHRKKTGGRTIQTPSDPDATYNGHKGEGCQVQLSETCHPDNSVQLITCAIPQTAADEDGDALPLVVAQKRLALRRAAEKTEEWKDRYRLWAGIEGTNNGFNSPSFVILCRSWACRGHPKGAHEVTTRSADPVARTPRCLRKTPNPGSCLLSAASQCGIRGCSLYAAAA